MAVDRVHISSHGAKVDEPAIADLIDRLSRFEGPPEQFLVHLLAVQCHVASAAAGAILRAAGSGRAEALAVYPPLTPGGTPPVWLAQAVESAPAVIAEGTTSIKPLRSPEEMYGQPAQRHLVMVPLRGGGGVRGVAAFLFEGSDPSALEVGRERLELTISLLSLYEMRLTLQRRQVDLRRLRMAMEVLAAVNEHTRFAAAAMALCNESASQWKCQRVSLGFLKGRYVHLKAMSHTEKFSRKMKVVQDVESAMEECFDQDVEIVYPPPSDAGCVSRSAGELSSCYGRSVVVSFPLRRAGQPLAVLTLERPEDQPFQIEEIESLRLLCDLSTARLADLHEQDRWIGARAAAQVRTGLAALVGPKHTWVKITAAAVFAAIVFLVFAKGDYRVEAPFVLEARDKQVVPAPFDGYLEAVFVEPGDLVGGAQTVLAKLDTSELRLKLAAAKAEEISYLKQASAALRDEKTAEAQIAQAQAHKMQAQMRLLEYQIQQATIISPIDGWVVTGDLKRQIGAPTKTGDVLFEVASIESLRAELSVPEDQIADVTTQMGGELAAASYPQQRVEFTVERINPVAEVVEQKNIFKVRAQLKERHDWMRPGMEGVAKITAGKRHYAWIWSRRLVNWVRMKLWW